MAGRVRRDVASLLGAIVFAMALLVLPAGAHSRDGGGDLPGLDIPGLTHGEMAVVAQHAGAIRALAERQTRTDPTFRRLLNFAALQRTYCLWGLMPGSVSDEESPFNACMHAYLSALRAVLLHMQGMPGAQAPALRLGADVAQEMERSAAAAVVCQYSGAPFNTAEVIMPPWRGIAAHPPSLLMACATALLLAAAGVALFLRPGAR